MSTTSARAALDTSDPDSPRSGAPSRKRPRRPRAVPAAPPVALAAQRVERQIAASASRVRTRTARQARTARQVMDALESEKDFMARVIAYAKLRHWLCFHDADSRRNTYGLPDLILCRWGATDAPARLIFAELKTERGKLTADQRHWLFTLGHVPGVEVVVWRPSAWPDIERALL